MSQIYTKPSLEKTMKTDGGAQISTYQNYIESCYHGDFPGNMFNLL